MRTGALAMASARCNHLHSFPTCTVSNQETADGALPKMLAQTRIKNVSYCTRTVTLAMASLLTCTVSNQEFDNDALPRMLAQSLKHAFKTHLMVRAPVNSISSAKRDSYPTCTVSNQESDRNADGTNVGAIIALKTRPMVHAPVYSMASANRDSYILARSAIKNLTKLLTKHNQKCWRDHYLSYSTRTGALYG